MIWRTCLDTLVNLINIHASPMWHRFMVLSVGHRNVEIDGFVSYCSLRSVNFCTATSDKITLQITFIIWIFKFLNIPWYSTHDHQLISFNDWDEMEWFSFFHYEILRSQFSWGPGRWKFIDNGRLPKFWFTRFIYS